MKKPWYIAQYEDLTYLHNQSVELKNFKEAFSSNPQEHRHCEMCWAKFGFFEGDNHLGYYEENSGSWICQDCYENFKDLFGWRLK